MPTTAEPTPPAPGSRCGDPAAPQRQRSARPRAGRPFLGRLLTTVLAAAIVTGPNPGHAAAPSTRAATAAKTAAGPSPPGAGATSPAATPPAPARASAAVAPAARTAAAVAPAARTAATQAAATTAPTAAALPAGSAVFFAVEGNPERGPLTLVPLSCYDASKKARAVGEACLPLLPATATVQTAGGPLQLGGPAMPQCPRQPLMGGRRLLGKVKAAPFLYGAWPSLAAVRYAEVPERSLHGAMAPIEKLARKAITAATALPVADLAIYQIIALALGSGPAIQKIYSVAVPDRRGRTQWSGLLIGDLQGKQAAVAAADELPGVRRHSMQIVGHLDIDHDGKLELLVNSGGDNLDRYSVRAYDGTMLNLLSYWHSCGD